MPVEVHICGSATFDLKKETATCMIQKICQNISTYNKIENGSTKDYPLGHHG